MAVLLVDVHRRIEARQEDFSSLSSRTPPVQPHSISEATQLPVRALALGQRRPRREHEGRGSRHGDRPIEWVTRPNKRRYEGRPVVGGMWITLERTVIIFHGFSTH